MLILKKGIRRQQKHEKITHGHHAKKNKYNDMSARYRLTMQIVSYGTTLHFYLLLQET